MPPKRLSRDDYSVGWICPLEVEQIAAMEMLDEEHETLPQPRSDTNIYNLGSINNHDRRSPQGWELPRRYCYHPDEDDISKPKIWPLGLD